MVQRTAFLKYLKKYEKKLENFNEKMKVTLLNKSKSEKGEKSTKKKNEFTDEKKKKNAKFVMSMTIKSISIFQTLKMHDDTK